MKKVLIISYFYPPCNLTAAQRVSGWTKYLSAFGYFPVVVTRNWDQPVNSPEDVLLSSGTEIVHEKHDTHEVYYLPYKASRRDKIFSENKEKKHLQKISKLYTLKDMFLENYRNSAIPFSNMYDFSKELIQKDNSIRLAVISGNPFVQFKFGYLLHKHTGIKWIADYRDDWNTSELETSFGGLRKVISGIQSASEKKWVGTAECITSVSSLYADKIGKFVDKEGFVILNGFDGIEGAEKPDAGTFHITYNGSLYPTQPIEPFLDAVKKIIDDQVSTLEIHLFFPGLAFDKSQQKRVEEYMSGYEKYVHITDRIPRKEVIHIQQKSDLLLMVSHSNIKGIPSSKLYEYIGLKKEVFLFPNDHDIIEETLNDTGLGIISNDESEIYPKLLAKVLDKQNGNFKSAEAANERILFYSRKNQAAELAHLLDRFTGEL